MLTEKEYKRAWREDAKNHWGFTREQFMRLLYAHKHGDARKKEYVEERLTDCNFHAECGYIHNGYYKEAMASFDDLL